MDTIRERVLQCIVDLTNDRRPAARVLVSQLLREKLAVVDDAIKRLKEDGLLRTVVPGIVEPVAQHPPSRPISRTTLPDGRTKLEIGDDLLELTPHEAQIVGRMFQGDAQAMTYWYEERRTGEQMVRLEAQVRSLQRQLHDTHRAMARNRPSRQPDLFEPADEGKPTRRRGAHIA